MITSTFDLGTFNAVASYSGTLDSRYFTSGQDLAAAIVQQARAHLPEGTPFQIVSYGYEDGRVGWAYNITPDNCVIEAEVTA